MELTEMNGHGPGNPGKKEPEKQKTKDLAPI